MQILMKSALKKVIIISLSLIILALIVLLVYLQFRKPQHIEPVVPAVEEVKESPEAVQSEPEKTEPTPEPLQSANPVNKPKAKASTPKANNPTNGLTYEQALSQYGKSYRVQIVNCAASPGKINIKTKINYMLDNRDSVHHVFVLNGQTYHLDAYSFAILPAPADVGLNFMTCDGKGSGVFNVFP